MGIFLQSQAVLGVPQAGGSRRVLQSLHPEFPLSYDNPFFNQQCLVL